MRRGLILGLVLLVTLTACKEDIKVSESETSVENTLVYAQALGDAAVAYSLGQEYPQEYATLLDNLNPLVDDTAIIKLSAESGDKLEEVVREILTVSMSLPGSPHFSPLVYGAEGGVNRLTALQKLYFPEGTAPNIGVAGQDGAISSEFMYWFLATSVKAGLLDKRLRAENDYTLSVSAGDCAQSKGGPTFNVFGTSITVAKADIGITTEDAKNYKLVRESFRYFDAGAYQAIYVTNPNASDTVRIEVTFQRTGNLADSDIAKYLADVANLSVALVK